MDNYSMAFQSNWIVQTLNVVLGTDDGSLLCALLKLNKTADTTLVMKHKLTWSHARGNLNMECSPISANELPRILACFSWDTSHKTNFSRLRYHEPLLPESKITNIRLDSVYRILVSRAAIYKKTNERDKITYPTREGRFTCGA